MSVSARRTAMKEQRNEKYYIRLARLRKLDIVKVLLPLKQNKMMIKWIGPFEDIDKIEELDYRVKLHDGKVKT